MDFYNKKGLGNKFKEALAETDKLLDKTKEKDKEFKLSFDEEWIIKNARFTKDSCFMDFANTRDIPLVWDDWQKHLTDLKAFNDKLKLKFS